MTYSLSSGKLKALYRNIYNDIANAVRMLGDIISCLQQTFSSVVTNNLVTHYPG